MRIACLVVFLLVAATAPGAAAAPRSDCASREVRAAVASFVGAFNRGDRAELDSLFAEEPRFEWYSSAQPGRRLGRAARTRDTLIGYLRARRRAGDRFALTAFGFNGNSRSHANFEFAVRRSSPGFRDGDWFRALSKGAAVCGGDSVRFIAMSVGGPVPSR